MAASSPQNAAGYKLRPVSTDVPAISDFAAAITGDDLLSKRMKEFRPGMPVWWLKHKSSSGIRIKDETR